MSLDFKIEPFFDDYSEDSKFYRILFRPGYAVQARELTQLQTILQEQIRRHGDHIFKEGAMVIPGQISYDLKVNYVRLSFTPGSTNTAILDALVGKEITNSAGLLAKVVTYSIAEGSDSETIFVKYQNSVRDSAGNNVSVFSATDVLTPVDGSSGLNVIVADAGTVPPVGLGCTATIQRGIYYIKKNFVLVTDKTIVLDKYTNTPSYRIGLQLSESVVYPEDDENLLDNALGSPNYSAPGAARYYIDLVLTKLSLTAVVDAEFIDLLRIDTGRVIFKIDRTQYAELEKTLARRTYDESGDYALSPFTTQTKEYRNNLRGDWAASEKFVQGDVIKVSDGAIGYWYFVAVTSGLTGGTRPTTFLPSVDSVIDNQIVWEYALYPSFNDGIYTFTAGNSLYSSFTLNDHIRLAGTFALCVEAGKAYVRGYEIEKISTEYIPITKSRELPVGSTALCSYFGLPAASLPASIDSVSNEMTSSIEFSSGSYTIASNIAYAPDVKTLELVNLHSVAKSGTPVTGTIIGRARVRGFEKDDSGGYKVFLFDINMNTGKTFNLVRCIYTTSTSFSADLTLVSGSAQLSAPADQGSSLVYSLPNYAIKDITLASYSVVVSLTPQTASGGNTISFTAPAGLTFESIETLSNYIAFDNTASGALVSLTTGMLSTTGGSQTLIISGLTSGHNYTVLATCNKAESTTSQTNFTVTDAYNTITTQVEATKTEIVLGHSLVTHIVSILMAPTVTPGVWNTAGTPSINITNRYSFNSGQDTTKASLSSISLVSGETAPTGPIRISYEYLESSSNASNFFGVNSYTWSSASKITYDQIYSVSNVSLRDSLDFRPYQSGAAYAERYFPKFGRTASFKYTYYLGRFDNLSLSSDGTYRVLRGIPSDTPVESNIVANSMKLAQINIEPYTFKRGSKLGVAVTPINNKRYTMRDIGTLERRIQDLEYYTSLTLTELDTKNMSIVDSDGLNRYQNGFLVDSFNGQGVGNSSSEDWNASIDIKNKELV